MIVFSPSVCSAATSSSRHLLRTPWVVTGAGGNEAIGGGGVEVVGEGGAVGAVGTEGEVGVLRDSPDFILLIKKRRKKKKGKQGLD